MEEQQSIMFALVILFLLDFHLIESKSGGGHYSSQRSLSSGTSSSSFGHGPMNQGPQAFYWNNPWINSDPNSWYEQCK